MKKENKKKDASHIPDLQNFEKIEAATKYYLE